MTGKIRTLVVDDEPVARARVLSLLRDEPDIEVVGECVERPAGGVRHRGDVAGPGVPRRPDAADGRLRARAHARRRAMPAVVFVTAYDEYALRAFEIHALDYLLKPFSAQRFKSALTHARQHLAKRQAHGGPRAADAPARRARRGAGAAGRGGAGAIAW